MIYEQRYMTMKNQLQKKSNDSHTHTTFFILLLWQLAANIKWAIC